MKPGLTSPRSPSRLRSSLFAAAVVLAAGACERNPIFGNATHATALDTVVVTALTGAPLGAFSGLDVTFHTPTRVQSDSAGTVTFDLALDLNAAGQVVLYPAARVVTDVRQAQRILGLQPSTEPFERITEAPSGGYTYDSTLVVPVGRTVIFDSRSGVCQGAFFPSVYGKLVADSVRGRSIYLRIASAPNCGFRQLIPGEIPRK